MKVQAITSDYWEAQLPVESVHKPGQVEKAFYFESPDSAAGAYFSTWRTNGARKLVHEFGEAYRSCRGRVSMFVPRNWIRRQIAP